MTDKTSDKFFFNKYGVNTKKNGRYSLYTTKANLDLADKSEDEKIKAYLQVCRNKLKEDKSVVAAAEHLAESLIINNEAQATRTVEAMMDPHVSRFVLNADMVKDNDRVQMSKNKGTDFVSFWVTLKS